LLAVLRAASRPVTRAALATAWLTDDAQRERCLDSLVADGLVEPLPRGRFRLPHAEAPSPEGPSRPDGQHAAQSPG
jgi:A/G-specific adenine glycosylase